VSLSEKVGSQNVAGNIYRDQPDDQLVRSSPSWRDNLLSAGRHGGVRSPLSVIGWSPNGGRLTSGELAAKKTSARRSDIASAKKAVAELIATVDMGNCKENASPCVQQKQMIYTTDELMSIATDKPISVEATDLNKKRDVEAEVVVDATASEGVEVAQGMLDPDDFDGDDENKENVFRAWSADEMAEMSDGFEMDRMVGDTVEQLDKQARTLRRRSQLSTDSSEYEDIVRQLRLVRQRQVELERLQRTLRSRLVHCRPASDDRQPLDLKMYPAHGDQDVMEPLDLRMSSVKHIETRCQELERENTRVILADITSKVVGDADPDDCFEIPDSPSAAATEAEPIGPIEDAADVDGVAPICENFPDDLVDNAAVQTAGDFVEGGRMKSTPLRYSPADCQADDDAEKVHTVGALDQYLASLNVSDISEANTLSPIVAASPDTSSEFANYQTYQRSLDALGRCIDPVAAAFVDGDEQVCCLL